MGLGIGRVELLKVQQLPRDMSTGGGILDCSSLLNWLECFTLNASYTNVFSLFNGEFSILCKPISVRTSQALMSLTTVTTISHKQCLPPLVHILIYNQPPSPIFTEPHKETAFWNLLLSMQPAYFETSTIV